MDKPIESLHCHITHHACDCVMDRLNRLENLLETIRLSESIGETIPFRILQDANNIDLKQKKGQSHEN